MAWQDRQYYRDRPHEGGIGTWLLSGRVPLFTAFGIRVQAHSSLIITAALVLLLGLGRNFGWQDRVQSMSVLFAIVLLHEFGHCFAARWVGGEADEILMTPLGGLALARPPHRWLPTFITVAAGPAVNLLICVLAGALLLALGGGLPWNPILFVPGQGHSLFSYRAYTLWVYQISWMLLVFNVLPVYPLDGGQMLQAGLWWKLGYRKSMNIATMVGLVGSVFMGMVAIATGFSLFLLLIAYSCFMTCLMMRRQLAEMGYEEEDETDYSAAYDIDAGRPKKARRSRWSMRRAAKRARKRAADERAERQHIDAILSKVSAHGMQSLTWREKRALRKATEHQRKRDAELSEATKL
jgi:Zn-dependent protease